MKVLSRLDEVLLLTVLRLKDNAYGVSIIKDIYKRTGEEIKLGGLWVSLDVLSRKGFLTKGLADPTPQRGGKSKIYYTITREGIEALHNVRKINDALWQGIVEILDAREQLS